MKKFTMILILIFLIPAVCSAKGIITLQVSPGTENNYGSWGFGIYQIKDKKPGFYLNCQFSADSQRDNYYDSLNKYSFDDPVIADMNEILMGNVGVTLGITEWLGLYTGIGYVSTTQTYEKYDPYHILAENGTYFVPGDDSGGGPNFNVGAVVNIKRLTLEVGYNSFLKIPYFGFGANF